MAFNTSKHAIWSLFFLTLHIALWHNGDSIAGETHQWQSANGKKVDAEFVALKEDMVSLRKDDGSVVSVPIQKLSATSQELARKLSKAVDVGPVNVSHEDPLIVNGKTAAEWAEILSKPDSYSALEIKQALDTANWQAFGSEGAIAVPALEAMARKLNRNKNRTQDEAVENGFEDEAIHALATIGPSARSTSKTLVSLLQTAYRMPRTSQSQEKDVDLVGLLLFALGEIGCDERGCVKVSSLMKQDLSRRFDYLKVLLASGEAAFPILERILESKNPEFCPFLLNLLGPLQAPLIKQVEPFLDDRELRLHAINALGKMGPYAAGSVPKLASIAQNGNTDALYALAQIGPQASNSMKPLYPLLKMNQVSESTISVFAMVCPEQLSAGGKKYEDSHPVDFFGDRLPIAQVREKTPEFRNSLCLIDAFLKAANGREYVRLDGNSLHIDFQFPPHDSINWDASLKVLRDSNVNIKSLAISIPMNALARKWAESLEYDHLKVTGLLTEQDIRRLSKCHPFTKLTVRPQFDGPAISSSELENYVQLGSLKTFELENGIEKDVVESLNVLRTKLPELQVILGDAVVPSIVQERYAASKRNRPYKAKSNNDGLDVPKSITETLKFKFDFIPYLSISPDGHLALVGAFGSQTIYDTSSGKQIAIVTAAGNLSTGDEPSPDPQRLDQLLLGDKDDDADDTTPVSEIGNLVSAFAVPDDREVVLIGDRGIGVLNREGESIGRVISMPEQFLTAAHSFAVSFDRKLIAIGASYGREGEKSNRVGLVVLEWPSLKEKGRIERLNADSYRLTFGRNSDCLFGELSDERSRFRPSKIKASDVKDEPIPWKANEGDLGKGPPVFVSAKEYNWASRRGINEAERAGIDVRMACELYPDNTVWVWEMLEDRTMNEEVLCIYRPGKAPEREDMCVFDWDRIKRLEATDELDQEVASEKKRNYVMRIHDGTTTAVAVARDGGFVMTGDSNGYLSLWSLNSGKVYVQTQGHNARIGTIELSESGTCAISKAHDGTIKIWKISRASGQP